MNSRSWLFASLVALLALPVSATIVVTSTADTVAADGQCTLREAIGAINGTANAECGSGSPINFNIPGGGLKTIEIATPLPTITTTVFINGFTQPGSVQNNQPFPVFNGVLQIELKPAAGSTAVNGLTIGPTAGNTGITGLVINGFSGAGLRIEATQTSINNNFFGTNAAGTAAVPNGRGIDVISSILAVLDRNIISGNSSHGIVFEGASSGYTKRNLIGLAVDGTSPLGNGGDGIRVKDLAAESGRAGEIGPLETPRATNKIGYNAGAGIAVVDTAFATGKDNIFVGNGGLEIDLGADGPTANDVCDADSGPNGLRNKPVNVTIRSNGTNFTEVFGDLEMAPNAGGNLVFYTISGGVKQYVAQQFLFNPSGCTRAFSFTLTTPFTPGSQVAVVFSTIDDFSEFGGPFTVQAFTPPAITTVAPSRGTHLGGTLVTVTGGPFDPGNKLRFDGIEVQATVVNSTTLQARTPPHAPGAVDVTVVSNRGNNTAPGAYTYVLLKQKNDVGGDGYSDLVFRNYSNGQNRMYIGETNAVVNLPAVTPTTMQISGMGDFDNDDRSDFVWRDVNTGVNATWLMDTQTVNVVTRQPFVKAGHFLPNLPGAHHSIAAVGDVDGDGDADLIWRNANDGTISVWLLQNGQYVIGHIIDVAPIGMRVRGAGDLDGDGKADILFRNAATGENAVWLMNGPLIAEGQPLPEVVDSAMQIVSIADMNNDGKADIVWRNEITGVNAVWLMNGTTLAEGRYLPAFTQTSALCSAADFANDTLPDLYFRSPSGNNAIMHNAATSDGSSTTSPFVDAAFTCLAQ